MAEINQGFKKTKQKNSRIFVFQTNYFSKMWRLLRHGATLRVWRVLWAAKEGGFVCVCVRVRVCASVAAADYKFANEKNVAVRSEARARPSERAAERPTLPVQPAAAFCKNISRPELPRLPCLRPRYAARTRQIAFSFFFPPPSFSDNTKTFGLELLYVLGFFSPPLFHNVNVNVNVRRPPHIYGLNLTAITWIIFDWI